MFVVVIVAVLTLEDVLGIDTASAGKRFIGPRSALCHEARYAALDWPLDDCRCVCTVTGVCRCTLIGMRVAAGAEKCGQSYGEDRFHLGRDTA